MVEAVRSRILARHTIITTADPQLHLQPRPNGDIVIRSRATMPALRSPDPRTAAAWASKSPGSASMDRTSRSITPP
ncbi:MAG TPA: hypothetical protein PK677_02930 [Acidiphilium sp.]|nr:MAG: hypothetical protein B7Z67_09330 [Acidiphilium sp. 21-60-14]OYV89459.1 MAG: hypothetical protein B7Z57_12450 [Acidiphilium sp. 37-60-79]OZB38175.1 MAG: hypothetical protein B7X48_14265 [Acidiphilium sp. 34-60-192]HQT87492.1 hypothetical protein [Acidiphilium sp.]